MPVKSLCECSVYKKSTSLAFTQRVPFFCLDSSRLFVSKVQCNAWSMPVCDQVMRQPRFALLLFEYFNPTVPWLNQWTMQTPTSCITSSIIQPDQIISKQSYEKPSSILGTLLKERLLNSRTIEKDTKIPQPQRKHQSGQDPGGNKRPERRPCLPLSINRFVREAPSWRSCCVLGSFHPLSSSMGKFIIHNSLWIWWVVAWVNKRAIQQ